MGTQVPWKRACRRSSNKHNEPSVPSVAQEYNPAKPGESVGTAVNPDLKSRLNHKPTVEEEAFFYELVDRMFKACNDPRRFDTLTLQSFEIEGDEDDTGYVEEEEYGWNVVIEERLDFGSKCDTLVHEMAHVDCWTRTENSDGTDEGDHCDIWGVSYAKMYRIYITTYNEYWETGR
jgi:hypothetical protein